jgi:hypothetical protein
VVSPVTISTLRPPAVKLACSQNNRKPFTISAPGDASGPVTGGSNPILIGGCGVCAAAGLFRSARPSTIDPSKREAGNFILSDIRFSPPMWPKSQSIFLVTNRLRCDHI